MCQLSTNKCKEDLVHDNGPDDVSWNFAFKMMCFAGRHAEGSARLRPQRDTAQFCIRGRQRLAGDFADRGARQRLCGTGLCRWRGGFNRSDFAVLVIAQMADKKLPGSSTDSNNANWNRPGTLAAAAAANGSITCTPGGTGLEQVHMYGAQALLPSLSGLGVKSSANPAWEPTCTVPHICQYLLDVCSSKSPSPACARVR